MTMMQPMTQGQSKDGRTRRMLKAVIALLVLLILVMLGAVWFLLDRDRGQSEAFVNDTCSLQDSGIDWLHEGRSLPVADPGSGDATSYGFSDIVTDLLCPGLGYALAKDLTPRGMSVESRSESGSVLVLFIDGVPVEQRYDVMEIEGVERASDTELLVQYRTQPGEGGADPVSLALSGDSDPDNSAPATASGDSEGFPSAGVVDPRIFASGPEAYGAYICELVAPEPRPAGASGSSSPGAGGAQPEDPSDGSGSGDTEGSGTATEYTRADVDRLAVAQPETTLPEGTGWVEMTADDGSVLRWDAGDWVAHAKGPHWPVAGTDASVVYFSSFQEPGGAIVDRGTGTAVVDDSAWSEPAFTLEKGTVLNLGVGAAPANLPRGLLYFDGTSIFHIGAHGGPVNSVAALSPISGFSEY